jgi:hypothetical protein
MHNSSSSLVIRKHETIRQDNILPPSSGENHDLGYIVWGEGFYAFVDGVRFGFIASESDEGELLRQVSVMCWN